LHAIKSDIERPRFEKSDIERPCNISFTRLRSVDFPPFAKMSTETAFVLETPAIMDEKEHETRDVEVNDIARERIMSGFTSSHTKLFIRHAIQSFEDWLSANSTESVIFDTDALSKWSKQILHRFLVRNSHSKERTIQGKQSQKHSPWN
jgi:hypothetical protein